jgi:glycerol-3-phosphate dehydrogenase
MPWRQQTIVGVWHRVWRGTPDSVDVPPEHLQAFIDEINSAMPSLALCVDDVAYWNAGLVLFGDAQTSTEHLSYGKRSRFIDHGVRHGLAGLFTLIGVRYTTARAESVQAVDLIQVHLGHQPSASRSHIEKLVGADKLSVTESRKQLNRQWPTAPAPSVRSLLHNFGDEVDSVLGLGNDAAQPALLPASHVLENELRFACREEMVTRLEDLLMRRTEVCTAYQPHRQTLDRAVIIAAEELGWDSRRQREERARLTATLEHKGFRSPPNGYPFAVQA